MPLYKPGTVVVWRATKQIVSHIMLRRNELWVYLTQRAEPVRPEELQLKPTVLSTVRQPERPRLHAPVKRVVLPPPVSSAVRVVPGVQLSSLMETPPPPLETTPPP